MTPSSDHIATPKERLAYLFTWLGLLCGVLAVGIQILPSADTWWHLASGDLILRTHSLPIRDVFSFTAGNHPWLNHEWLAEVAFSSIYSRLGLPGLCLLKLCLLALSAAILPAWSLYRNKRRHDWLWLIPALLYVCGWSFFVDVRAYLLTYLGISLTSFCLLEHQRSGRRKWLIVCPLFQLLWVNSHGGFILGPAIMGVYFLFGPRRKELGVATGATLLAACFNPEGPAMLAFPFSLLHKDAFSVGLNEWAKPDLLGAQLPYLCLVALTLIAAVIQRKTLNRPLFFSSLAFLLLGLMAWRHEPLAGIMLCYLLPHVLPEVKKTGAQSLVVSLLVLLAGAFWLNQKRDTSAEKMMGYSFFPSEAVTFLSAHPELPHHLFNPYGWGGFLLWRLPPPYKIFFDGRAHTVYPEDVFRDGYYLQYGDSWLKLLESRGIQTPPLSRLEVLEKYGVNLVLTNKFQGDLTAFLGSSGQWQPIFEDRTSVLFLRRPAP